MEYRSILSSQTLDINATANADEKCGVRYEQRQRKLQALNEMMYNRLDKPPKNNILRETGVEPKPECLAKDEASWTDADRLEVSKYNQKCENLCKAQETLRNELISEMKRLLLPDKNI